MAGRLPLQDLLERGAYHVVAVHLLLGLVWRSGGQPKWLPTKGILEKVSDGAVTLGFLFFTLGLAIGAYWMYTLWGRYWDWDTKASSSLVV